MVNPQKMRCSHILLSWDEAINSTHSRDLAFAIMDAKDIIESLLRGGYTWKVAVKENSACDSWVKGGDLGWFSADEITSEIWSACLITEIDNLHPEPIQTPFGVHILYRTG